MSKQEKNAYIREKLSVLRQFLIRPTAEQLAHMRGLNSEIAIDNFARSLIVNALSA